MGLLSPTDSLPLNSKPNGLITTLSLSFFLTFFLPLPTNVLMNLEPAESISLSLHSLPHVISFFWNDSPPPTFCPF